METDGQRRSLGEAMTRPDRPYRFTVVYPNATSHWDYATKEDRAAATLGVDGECTTVTSRKPVKPGTPVVTWGSAEIASLRKLYAAAMEVRSWFDPPKHVQNALIRAVHDHAEKFGKPTEQP